MVQSKTTTPDLSIVRNWKELRDQLTAHGWLVNIPFESVKAHWLLEGEQRLNASYYANEVTAALRAVHDSDFEVETIGVIAKEPYYPGRFKRVYADNDKDGDPFLTASHTFHFRPNSEKYLAFNTGYVDACRVAKGTMLITRSGSVGRCVLVGERLSRFAISDDAIRLEPQDVPIGYLYAYLKSWIGQALISKDQYGSAIKHLEPNHIAGIPIPLISEASRLAIHSEIANAYSLRYQANQLLDQAETELYSALHLPAFDVGLVPYLTIPPQKTVYPEMPHPKAFSLKVSELRDRFDASRYIPVAKTAINTVKQSKYPAIQLKAIVKKVYVAPRFKRIYVPQRYGIPFLQGSHLPQLLPLDLKYLSKTNTEKIDRWIIHKGWVLVTCSGTIGRVALASSAQDGWAASQHILRIIPNETKGNSGYIAAFLMTPYGQHQLTSKIYGGVVDKLTEEDTEEVWIPEAPLPLQESIGQLVIEAFELKDQANMIEETAIRSLEEIIGKSALLSG